MDDRKETYQELLDRYWWESEHFLNIVTRDESWVSYYDPEVRKNIVTVTPPLIRRSEAKNHEKNHVRNSCCLSSRIRTASFIGKFCDQVRRLISKDIVLATLKRRLLYIRPTRTQFFLQHHNTRPHTSAHRQLVGLKRADSYLFFTLLKTLISRRAIFIYSNI